MGCKILIIDDDPDYIAAIRAFLENAGYTVSSAADSMEGKAALEREVPDLVILDVLMEGKAAGFIFSRQLRKDARFANLPILMLTSMREKTGFVFPGQTIHQDFLPVDDFVDKAIEPAQLIERIAALLEKSRGTPR